MLDSVQLWVRSLRDAKPLLQNQSNVVRITISNERERERNFRGYVMYTPKPEGS